MLSTTLPPSPYTTHRKLKISLGSFLQLHEKFCVYKLVRFLGAFTKLRKATISFISVSPAARSSEWNNSGPIGRISMKFDIWVFFENPPRKFKCRYYRTRITGALHEDLCMFMISRSLLLRMTNVVYESCRENQNTHFVFNNFFFGRKSCCF